MVSGSVVDAECGGMEADGSLDLALEADVGLVGGEIGSCIYCAG